MSTTEQAVGNLLDEQDWTGKVFSDGWVDAPETVETIAPATGDVLGTAGVANAASVGAAAKSAVRAQRAWAATPMVERVAVVRRAGELLELHREEISGWMIRESGAIEGKVAHEIGASIGQLEQAATLTSDQLEQARRFRRRGSARALDRVAVADLEGEGRAVPVLGHPRVTRRPRPARSRFARTAPGVVQPWGTPP